MKLLKNVCILLVLLIAFAGTASAYSLTFVDESGAPIPADIVLRPGDSITVYVKLTEISVADTGKTFSYSNSSVVKIMGSTGTAAYNDIVITTPATLTTNPVVGGSYIDPNPTIIEIMSNAPGDATIYQVDIGVGTGYAVGDVGVTSGSRDITSEIPEFPTIALPVAAILGLAFFMQRRKEE
jgi:hypothetical protein